MIETKRENIVDASHLAREQRLMQEAKNNKEKVLFDDFINYNQENVVEVYSEVEKIRSYAFF